MSSNWEKTHFFERESNIYSFSQNPLLRKNKDLHIYMPWDSKTDNERMFKIKEIISKNKMAHIPYMQKDGKKISIDLESLGRLNAQVKDNRETHLIMSNLDSIHVFRVKKIVNKKDLKNYDEKTYAFKNLDWKKYDTWIQVDDLFVLEANHDGSVNLITTQLDNLLTSVQTQNIFKPSQKMLLDSKEEGDAFERERWIDMNRSLTYDYFIRSCELKDNIYQDSWDYLSRRTQHELISCELKRHTGLFYRDIEKWEYLRASFNCYLNALYSELNEVYIFPLLNAITDYASLKEAWFELESGLVNPKVQELIKELLAGERKQMDSLEDFLFYTKSAKSFLFTLKQKFTKKIHKEEFLLVENFLCRQESLIESLICRKIIHKIESMIEIMEWINETDKQITQAPSKLVKDCNLKLSHLLSIMASASYTDNIFFKLLEEKAAKGIVQKSFEDEVKSLLNIKLKQEA